MTYRDFERELLRLAFTTQAELSPPSLAFILDIPIAEAESYMHRLLAAGVLELSSDDDGHLTYVMPDRPVQPLRPDDPALVGATCITTWPAQAAAGPHGGSPGLGGSGSLGERSLGGPPGAIATVRAALPARRQSSSQAAGALVLNALLCPGVGSLVAGRTKTGLAQMMMFFIGLPLLIVTVGAPLMMAAWLWGVATGAQLLAEARD
ncbi:MAG TPA: hypothetical protein VFG83_05145 [Kofleriaceae bacterium]|nr:hypothetical protein [Kofleriaceae bacterium]